MLARHLFFQLNCKSIMVIPINMKVFNNFFGDQLAILTTHLLSPYIWIDILIWKTAIKMMCVWLNLCPYVIVTDMSHCPQQSFLFSQLRVFPVSSESYQLPVVHSFHQELENSGHCQRNKTILWKTYDYCTRYAETCNSNVLLSIMWENPEKHFIF